MRGALGLVICLSLASFSPFVGAAASTDDAWPGEPIDNHIHMTWAALTMEVNEWAEAIQSIIENDDEWKEMCQKAPIAVQGLDAESNRFRWGKFYDSIMKSDSQVKN